MDGSKLTPLTELAVCVDSEGFSLLVIFPGPQLPRLSYAVMQLKVPKTYLHFSIESFYIPPCLSLHGHGSIFKAIIGKLPDYLC